MRRYADPHRCPSCGHVLALGSTSCQSCGVLLQGPLSEELFATLLRADDLVTRLRTASDTPVVPPAVPPVVQPVVEPPSTLATAPVRAAVPASSHGPGSVPKILLALGATCLLVAALVFLAVTWSVLGVAGRTATLVVLTLATGALTAWAARRDLRGATEALGLVTIGLAALDLVGARNAGWLGHPSEATFSVVMGALLLVGGVAATVALARSRVGGFLAGEAAAVLGSALLPIGLATQRWGDTAPRLAVATVLAVLVTSAVWALVRTGQAPLRVTGWGSSLVAAGVWLALVGAGLDRLELHPSVQSWWGRLEVWPLLVAAAIAVGLAAVRRVPRAVRVLALGAGMVPLALAVIAPALDEGPTGATAVVIAAVVAGVAMVVLLDRPWAAAGLGVTLLGSVYLSFQMVMLGGAALSRWAAAVATGWAGGANDRFLELGRDADTAHPLLLPLCVVTLAAVVLAVSRLADGGLDLMPAVAMTPVLAVLGLSGIATLLLFPVPVWAVLVALLALALVFSVPAVRDDDPAAVGATGVFLLGALLLGLHDELLTAVALAVAVPVVASYHWRTRSERGTQLAGAAVPAGLAALAWTAGALAGAAGSWTALAGLLVVGTLALGRVLVPARPGTDAGRVNLQVGAVELGALVAAAPLSVAGVDAAALSEQSVWTALYLTVTGAAATAMALLRADRRTVGWLGGALLATATWVRLAELGITAPEPYTLPSALALLVVGWFHLRRHPESSTHRALGPGLALALVPSLLWVLEEPLTLRALVLGMACLGLVVAGVQARWSAPLLQGAVVGGLVVLREAAPYVGAAVPRWGLIGAAGVLLIAMGVTWEQRLVQAHSVATYVRRLR